jgi:omega-hydroxy-beta-dihydromenaquinone-9 sulfotransferase
MPNTPSDKTPREWAPRFWEGADYFAWLRLLARNNFAVEPPYWYIAAIVSCSTFAHTVLRWLQHGLHGDRIAATRIDPPPVFVIGHWRTGTTLLHELLILDDRHTSPTTLHCFSPCDFLVAERVLKKFLWFLVPEKRPMDNMAAGWDKPQEDEFALCLLGHPSTYADIAFPNRPPLYPGALDLSGLTRRELAAWKRGLVQFLKAVQSRDPRRLVLKSPPHTARIPTLLEVFPEARFVHIVRDPYVVYPSTVNLWSAFANKHGFQTPRRPELIEEKVFREFRTVYERLEETKGLIPAGHFAEIRYEELTGNLVGAMEAVYSQLGLGVFETVKPKLEAFVAANKGYEKNKWDMTPQLREKIRGRWGDIIDRLGYGGRKEN